MLDKGYKDEIKKFTQAYNGVQELSNKYFASFGKASGDVKKKLEILKNTAVESTINNLAETGLQIGVTNGLRNILKTNITGGGSYVDLTKELKDYITGTPEQTGKVSQYVRTYATTSINQFSAEYNKALAQDLGLEWYQYEGSLLETSRPFCKMAVDKHYIHVSEFPTILKGDFGPLGTVKLYDKTGLPEGLMEGTDPDNFPRRRGGWNCGHQLIAVDSLLVPTAKKLAVWNTPAYKEWEKEQFKKAQPAPPAPPPVPAKPATVAELAVKAIPPVKMPAGVVRTAAEEKHLETIQTNNKEHLEAMEKKDMVFYPEMAKYWPENIKIEFNEVKGSFFQSGQGYIADKIVISDNERAERPYFKKKIMLHEGAHAIHYNQKVITHTAVDPVYEKFFKGLKKIIKGKELEIENVLRKWRNDNFDDKDKLEEVTVMTDTLGGLTKGKYGWGHDVAYYKRQNHGHMEVFAHAVTIAKLGNQLGSEHEALKALIDEMKVYGLQWLK